MKSFRNLRITALALLLPGMIILYSGCSDKRETARETADFCSDWKFYKGDTAAAMEPGFNDADWRRLDLPHDWSIEGPFSADNPAGTGGGALPGGIGWYRKAFTLKADSKKSQVFIDFDGVYMNSEVWINGHYLGKRPYGYSSFRYELTPYLNFGENGNMLAVRVDNSRQPNSRWYSGSGIYRKVWLVRTNKVHVDHWGTFIRTEKPVMNSSMVHLETRIRNSNETEKQVNVKTEIFDEGGGLKARKKSSYTLPADSVTVVNLDLEVRDPELWSIEDPHLYTAVTHIYSDGGLADNYTTTFGIRNFRFDPDSGFFLNGLPVKIKGVCNHHDLGCLGTAVNDRALVRQLEILKDMGCNSIRTSHNPPAPDLLDLCDKMGFVVMDEAFDMWKRRKTPYDYHLYWDEWHKRDLQDMVLRDRNHPSVILWSIGNEILEQWDSTGLDMARELAGIVKHLDTTRPVTSAMNDPEPYNYLIRSGALDVIGANYHLEAYAGFPEKIAGKAFIASETTSAIASRGSYDMPADSVRIWPRDWRKPEPMNEDFTCSAYDNCRVGWGSTHEEAWKVVKNLDHIAGMYVWTGFDYLGEPTPYPWPARSSYFGIIDLAGFPKDAYYFYKSEWTDDPVLHIFPHWNWQEGDSIDVWAYTNCDEVELFLNGKSMGRLQKGSDQMHLAWRLAYVPGELRAVGRFTETGETLERTVRTAGKPARISLDADRSNILAARNDLSFVTVNITDTAGTLAPRADNEVTFTVDGPGTIAGVDNGLQTSLEPFLADHRKAFNGKCLVVIRSQDRPGTITLTASSPGLQQASVAIRALKGK